MQTLKFALSLALACTASHGFATIVPVEDDVVATALESQGGAYVDGYVELNRTQNTISLALQPVMTRCPANRLCTDVMPEAQDYFLTEVSRVVDECGAVIYSAEQATDRLIKVIVSDNSAYNYELCPTFAPLPLTSVRVEETFLNGSDADRQEDSLAGSDLTAVRH